MNRNKHKVPALIMVAIVVVTFAAMVFWAVSDEFTNKQWFDTTYSFERAIVYLPDGRVIDGELTSWLDFENSDQVQVKINDVTYLTHISNVCLISE